MCALSSWILGIINFESRQIAHKVLSRHKWWRFQIYIYNVSLQSTSNFQQRKKKKKSRSFQLAVKPQQKILTCILIVRRSGSVIIDASVQLRIAALHFVIGLLWLYIWLRCCRRRWPNKPIGSTDFTVLTHWRCTLTSSEQIRNQEVTVRITVP